MKEAEVILARSAGFCFGVHRAVDTVYERTGMENVYTYGPIIHNDEVVKDLESKGVKAISDVAQLDGIDNATVIIRSHGVSKNVYESIKTKNYEVVDATCPFVLKIHRIVEQESKAGKQIVIIGNEKHPEVEGIKGWSVSPVYIVDSILTFAFTNLIQFSRIGTTLVTNDNHRTNFPCNISCLCLTFFRGITNSIFNGNIVTLFVDNFN